VSVALGIVHPPQMDSQFVKSLFGLLRDRDDEIAGAIFVPGASGRLDNSRNAVARMFLQKDTEWLLTLDTDMVFAVTDFDALCASADEQDVPIISGLYFVDERPPRAAVARTSQDGVIKSIADWDMDQLVDVDWCGAGFMLIHRSVFEKLGDEPYRQDIVAPSGALVGEDYAFCERARQAGFPIKVNPNIFIGHSKTRVLGFE
jgi:GT2 family glycosyltransferase